MKKEDGVFPMDKNAEERRALRSGRLEPLSGPAQILLLSLFAISRLWSGRDRATRRRSSFVFWQAR
jgi:hypothetical protein